MSDVGTRDRQNIVEAGVYWNHLCNGKGTIKIRDCKAVVNNHQEDLEVNLCVKLTHPAVLNIGSSATSWISLSRLNTHASHRASACWSLEPG